MWSLRIGSASLCTLDLEKDRIYFTVTFFGLYSSVITGAYKSLLLLQPYRFCLKQRTKMSSTCLQNSATLPPVIIRSTAFSKDLIIVRTRFVKFTLVDLNASSTESEPSSLFTYSTRSILHTPIPVTTY